MTKGLIYLTVIGLMAQHLCAQERNWIYQYNDQLTEGEHYVIEQAPEKIRIIAGFGNPSLRFKFEARTEELQGGNWVDIGPGDIQSIETYAGNPGMVWLEINGDPDKNHVYGARDLWAIYLGTPYTTSSRIWWIRISRDLGDVWLSDFDSIGLIQVDGDLLAGLVAQEEITNAVTVGGNLTEAVMGDALQAVTFNGNGPHTGTITARTGGVGAVTLRGPFSGTLSCAGNANGPIDIDGDLTGNLVIGGNVSTSIRISGDVCDVGDNRIRIKHMAGGHFECEDLEIKDGYDGWMVLGQDLSGEELYTVEQTGTININGTLSGVLISRSRCGLTIDVNELNGGWESYEKIACGGIFSLPGFTDNFDLDIDTFTQGLINVRGGPISQTYSPEFLGSISIGGDIGNDSPTNVARIVARDVFNEQPNDVPIPIGANIRIGGDLYPGLGDQPGEPNDVPVPAIVATGDLDGQILIDGSLLDGDPNEIKIEGQLDPQSTATIAVDYDGWHATHTWQTGATVLVNDVEYGGNRPEMHIWEITGCKGDMNNDGDVNSDDDDHFDDALNDIPQYESDFPGLEGSRIWHGDANADGTFDQDDQVSYDFLSSEECCVTDWSFCPTDLDYDGDTDLNDLALLLADYGCTSDCTGDVDGDDDVDLSDLAVLLSVYGDDCDCSSAGPGSGGGRSSISVYVEAYDTGGYTGAGFNGEVDHFVFDLKIELSDPNDDWVATGAELDTYNDATFRLSTTPTTPDQYATFVAAPWTSVPGSATASVAGAYDPPDPTCEFATTGINLAWFDTADSNDGPATVMRIVIDVSEVSGADVSEGFGSVYFSTTGKTRREDILVADLASGTGTADSAPGLKSLSGEFYVKGQE